MIIASAGMYWMLLLLPLAITQRISDEIYAPIDTAVACFRRLNATHQTGCTSPDSGSVGVLQLVQTIEDAKWLIKAKAGPHAALISTSHFQLEIVDILINSTDNVAGILVYNNETDRPSFQSEESHCPNEYTSEPRSCPAGGWNPHGSELLKRDIPFPIFYLPQGSKEYLDSIIECYDRFNKDDRDNQHGRPLCAIEFNAFMFAVVDSKNCMRRSQGSYLQSSSRFCEPLGDRNIFYSIYPRTIADNASKRIEEKPKSIFLITARMDSTSLFDESILRIYLQRYLSEYGSQRVAPGAASTVVGLVTLQTLAVALSKMMPENFADGNVVFAIFNGEAYDYIGSGRLAYDMKEGNYPHIDPDSIRVHLEIGQIGGAITDDPWIITALAPDVKEKDEIFKFVEVLKAKDPNLGLTIKFDDHIPPSSLHSFRRVLGPEKFNHLLILDHEPSETFKNKYYHGVFDDSQNVGFRYRNVSVTSDGQFETTDDMISQGHLEATSMQVKIANLTKALAETLYDQLTGTGYTGDNKASAHMVDELLYCWLSNQNCRIFRAINTEITDKGSVLPPMPLYVSVRSWIGAATVAATRSLALLTSRHIVAAKECPASNQTGVTNSWMVGWNESGVCVSANVNTSEASSPAFTIQDYDFSSNLYSSWTESTWRATWSRLLVKAGGKGAEVAGIAGAAITLTTAAIALLVAARHETLLPSYRRPALPLRVDC